MAELVIFAFLPTSLLGLQRDPLQALGILVSTLLSDLVEYLFRQRNTLIRNIARDIPRPSTMTHYAAF